MRILLLTTVLLFATEFLFAQTLTGKIVDENRQPVVFANVTLLALPDSTFAGGTTTDETGVFAIAANKKSNKSLLKISFLAAESLSLTIDKESPTDLGEIVLKSNAIQMREVVVSAQTPKIRFERGTYIADIANSMAATGNTVESLLNQLPGVWASATGISVNGKSGVSVYLNNQQVKLSEETLMKYLQTIRSENIIRIEIIQNASAEFDAEGAGGVIRIVTKKVADEGLRGMISTSALYENYPGIAPYFALIYGRGKFGAILAFDANKSKWLGNIESYSMDLVNSTNYQTKGTDTIYDLSYATSLTLNYDFNPLSKLILTSFYTYWSKDEHFDEMTIVSGYRPTNIGATRNLHGSEQNMYLGTLSANYELAFDPEGKNKITLLADYVNQYKYRVTDRLQYLNTDDAGNLISDENLLNEQGKPYQIYSGEIRYNHDFGNAGSGTTGLKFGSSSIRNNLSVGEKTAGIWTEKPESGYDFRFAEELFSGFYRYDLKREKWSLTAGLRGEHTAGSVSGLTKNTKRFDLFPSFYADFNPNKHHNFGFAYTRRIKRISYFTLMPQRFYHSRYEIYEGNPALKPNILNNLTLNYNIDEKYYLSASFSWSDNALSQYNKTELIDNRSVLVSTYTDGIKAKSFNFNIYVPIKFASWWSCTNKADFSLDAFNTPENKFTGFNYDLFTQHDFSLPYGFNAQILYRYFSESKSAYTVTYPYNLLNVSLKKSLSKDKNLNIKLEANRLIFNKNGEETKNARTFVQSFTLFNRRPLFKLTLSYSFNKGTEKQVQEAQKSNSQESSRTY